MKKSTINLTTATDFIPNIWGKEILNYVKKELWVLKKLSDLYPAPIDKRNWLRKRLDTLESWIGGVRFRMGEWVAGTSLTREDW